MTTTHTLETSEVDLAYDVCGPLPTADGRPPLFMIGQPMAASGFATLASLFPNRTVVTYDPRGLGRSTRKDGRVDNAPTVQADDVHAVIETLGVGPVEMFASSGGAVTALALVPAYPHDVTTLVAHEPPLIPVLPDAEAAKRAQAGVRDAYEANGSNAGMAAFIAMTSWRGEFSDDYFAQQPPDLVTNTRLACSAFFGTGRPGERIPRITAAAIMEKAQTNSIKRLVTMMIEQLLEIMPELQEVAAWHTVGQRRTLDARPGLYRQSV
jgi:pimeloyl-ACP methyl ester carboxylesterase